jgi:glycerophosphoryl diester phosphodiesterase
MDPFRFRRRPGALPRIYGHRGCKAYVVENTMPSFERAIADGADGIELDVRTTREGVVVVMHDRDLERMTDGRDRRACGDLLVSELTAIELDGPSGPATPPLLADVLDWADRRDILVNIELKHDTLDKALLVSGVARLLRGRSRVAQRVLFSSFEPELLARLALALPAIPRAFLVHAGQGFARTSLAPLVARATGSIALHPERTLCTPELLAGLRARGLLLNVWTVNHAIEAIDLARLGVDGIITDDPALIRAALQPAPTSRS